MIVILAVFALDVLATLLAARLLRPRTGWLRALIVFAAPLPFPLVCAIVAALLEGPTRLMGKEDGQSMGGLLSVCFAAAMLYLLGLIVSAFAVKPSRDPPNDIDGIADVFS